MGNQEGEATRLVKTTELSLPCFSTGVEIIFVSSFLGRRPGQQEEEGRVKVHIHTSPPPPKKNNNRENSKGKYLNVTASRDVCNLSPHSLACLACSLGVTRGVGLPPPRGSCLSRMHTGADQCITATRTTCRDMHGDLFPVARIPSPGCVQVRANRERQVTTSPISSHQARSSLKKVV